MGEGDPLPDGEPWPALRRARGAGGAARPPSLAQPRPKGAGEGVGIAFGGWPGASEPATAACRLNDDGTLTVVVGSSDISGTKTGMMLLAAEAFGIAPEAINVVTADTNTAPYAGASGGSKIT